MSSKFIKDPDAILDYIWDWSDWLVDDTIAESVWVLPDGITKESSSYTDTTATIWLSSGTVGTVYSIINRITTVAGRTEDRTKKFKIKER